MKMHRRIEFICLDKLHCGPCRFWAEQKCMLNGEPLSIDAHGDSTFRTEECKRESRQDNDEWRKDHGWPELTEEQKRENLFRNMGTT